MRSAKFKLPSFCFSRRIASFSLDFSLQLILILTTVTFSVGEATDLLKQNQNEKSNNCTVSCGGGSDRNGPKFQIQNQNQNQNRNVEWKPEPKTETILIRESAPLSMPMNLIRFEETSTSPSPFGNFEFDSPESLQDRILQDEKKVHNLTKTLNTILEDYDKRIRPQFYGPPVQVGITVMVKSLASISEVDMEFKIDFYLRQFWTDRRLQFEMQPRVNVISLSHEFIHQIWQPDTFFPNEKKSYIHSATVLNEFIRLNSDGKILKSTRLTLTATCPMSLHLFPMDHQICSMELGSYGFNNESIQYEWEEGDDSIKMGLNSVILPQFQVLGHRKNKAWSITTTGNYSKLQVEFLFVRSLNYYLTQIYVPAALIVVISWFALYMGREAAAERMALGVTTVLTITTLLLSTNSNSPKISYVKAIDIYLGICFAYVFASLLQSASIGYLAKKIKEQEIAIETARRKMAFKKSLARQEKKVQTRQMQIQQQKQQQQLLHKQQQQQQLVRKTSLPLPIPSRAQSRNSLSGKFKDGQVHAQPIQGYPNPQRVIPSISLQDIDDNCVELQKALSIKSCPSKGSLVGSKAGLSELDLDVEKNSVNSMSMRVKAGSTKGNLSDTSSVATERDEDEENGDEDDDDDETVIYPLRKFDGERVHEAIVRNRTRMALCDVMSRILFPVGFLLFNIVYWVYYLNVSKLDHIESWK